MDMLNLTLTQVPGISRSEAQLLRKLNLTTLGDLLHYYPRKHLHFQRTRIRAIQAGETVTLVGKVTHHHICNTRRPGLTLQKWIIRDHTGSIACTQFYHHSFYQSYQWRREQQQLYAQGAIVVVTGTVKADRYSPSGLGINNPQMQVVNLAEAKAAGSSIVPIYPLRKGVTNELVRKCTAIAITHLNQLQDPLPQALRQRYGLLELTEAVTNIHFPTTSTALAEARQRLVFDEFFYLTLALALRRYYFSQSQGVPCTARGRLIDRFAQNLPFTLTTAQERVIQEILTDLGEPVPMNRLLQGDVGSGKTCVACFAALGAIQSGYQVALMSPTEVLAEQHYTKIQQWFEPLGVSVGLLTGSTPTPQRRELHTQLQYGTLSLLVGTQALIQDTVKFQQLGLAIIDEQHRFGVHNRLGLQQKGHSPHLLTMTATPIPRSLALTIHGDLAISQIDQLPPGRKPIATQRLTSRSRKKAYQRIRAEIAEGRQAYIILPLVEESDKLELKAATTEHTYLQAEVFPDVKVGLLHGRMSLAEKQAAIGQFQAGRTPILVSTTVVEVGVDAPQATVIVIEDAERFGLAQLHQLRGRVVRNSYQSYCYLISDSRSESSQMRLKTMEQSQDGFYLAQVDLQLRGAGKVLGTEQSGVPEFALADLVEDETILEAANQAASLVIKKNPALTRFPQLKQELHRRGLVRDSEQLMVLN
jgi:ATP-dependent DNA helicase RecG